MAKLMATQTIYVWPKDEESGEEYFTLYTDEEYQQECERAGVDSLDGVLTSIDGEVIDEIEASEDSYSAQGESIAVVHIPDEKYQEVQDLLDLYQDTERKINELFHNSIK